jgi:hypothetical protein
MPNLAESSGDGSKNLIDVKGDRNQAICHNFGTASGNVGRDIEQSNDILGTLLCPQVCYSIECFECCISIRLIR